MGVFYLLDSKSEINADSRYANAPSTETTSLISSDKINIPSSEIHQLLLSGRTKVFIAGLSFLNGRERN